MTFQPRGLFQLEKKNRLRGDTQQQHTTATNKLGVSTIAIARHDHVIISSTLLLYHVIMCMLHLDTLLWCTYVLYVFIMI